MAYHVSNLGAYGTEAAQYADLNGYVPEAGDDWRDLQWDAAIEWSDEAWAEHVAGAVAATERAERDLAQWQTSD